MTHICTSLGQGASVILVSTVSLASQSYHCKLWFKRLNHISLSSKPRVSLISVSFGSFWRSNIRHPPIERVTTVSICNSQCMTSLSLSLLCHILANEGLQRVTVTYVTSMSLVCHSSVSLDCHCHWFVTFFP